jgi:hypothetical protein
VRSTSLFSLRAKLAPGDSRPESARSKGAISFDKRFEGNPYWRATGLTR